MKISREMVGGFGEFDSSVGKVVRWIAVGLVMFIFVARWAASKGSRPSPKKVDESVKGALLGFPILRGALLEVTSILGFDEKSEEMICGWVPERGLEVEVDWDTIGIGVLVACVLGRFKGRIPFFS